LLNPDEARSLLIWLNNPASYKQGLNEQEWQAFCSICQQKYKFHPDKDGQLNAASLLGERNEAWATVWERYKEAPFAYTVIPQLLNQVQPPQSELLGRSETWPQENEAAEEELRDGLAVSPIRWKMRPGKGFANWKSSTAGDVTGSGHSWASLRWLWRWSIYRT